ncbi:hypothetical protein KEM56_000440 [Ascosphaera pollenicola]|nr:hypothetical protein KEM56_000440 [Ascosphaera pollenicola]
MKQKLPRQGAVIFYGLANSSVRFLTRYPADTLLCLQEVLHNQLIDIKNGLNDVSTAREEDEWAYIGVGRDDGETKGEYSPIFYRKAVWDLLEWKTVWLSETPEKPSKGWDAASTRILTVGLFKNKSSGAVILAMTTHLDDQGSVSRREGAKLILDVISSYRTSATYADQLAGFFLAGDFNSQATQEAYTVVTSEQSPLLDAHGLLPKELRHGDELTWTGFGYEGEPQTRIDYAFLGPKGGQDAAFPWKVLDYACVPARFDDGVYLSDHRPVIVDAELNPNLMLSPGRCAAMTTSQPDLTLPDILPDTDGLINISGDDVAIYTLFDLDTKELNALRNICQAEYFSVNSDHLNDSDDEDTRGHAKNTQQICKTPPRAVFAGRPLREVVDYHIALCRDSPRRKWDSCEIIVAVHKDSWRERVLLVNLRENCEWQSKYGWMEEQPEEAEKAGIDLDAWRPDYFWCEPEHSACLAANLQIGNMGWDEIKDGWDLDASS